MQQPFARSSAVTLADLALDAVRTGDVETLERALAVGLPVETCSRRGDSLLTLACAHGHLDAVCAILDAGADPDVPDGGGQTPLAHAATRGFIDVAQALVHAGAAIGMAAPDGRTPLMGAAAFNRAAMVEWLLMHGANPDVRDAAGARALDIALAMGAMAARAVLTSGIADAGRGRFSLS